MRDFRFWGLLPAHVLMALTLIVPILIIVAVSFSTRGAYGGFEFTFTTDAYRQILFNEGWTGELEFNPQYLYIIGRTVLLACCTTFLCMALAFPIAYYLSFHVTRRKALWLFMITIPFWTSYLLRVFLWKVILGYNGVLNSALTGLGIIDEPLTFLLYNINAVIITLAHAWAPFAILPIFVALEKIDRSLLEAAEDLGDGPVRRFFRVTLPLAMPGVIASILIVLIPTVGDFITPRLVGGTDGLMIANMIQIQFGKANNAPLGAALAVSSMVIVASISLVIYLAGKRFGGKTQ